MVFLNGLVNSLSIKFLKLLSDQFIKIARLNKKKIFNINRKRLYIKIIWIGLYSCDIIFEKIYQ